MIVVPLRLKHPPRRACAFELNQDRLDFRASSARSKNAGCSAVSVATMLCLIAHQSCILMHRPLGSPPTERARHRPPRPSLGDGDLDVRAKRRRFKDEIAHLGEAFNSHGKVGHPALHFGRSGAASSTNEPTSCSKPTSGSNSMATTDQLTGVVEPTLLRGRRTPRHRGRAPQPATAVRRPGRRRQIQVHQRQLWPPDRRRGAKGGGRASSVTEQRAQGRSAWPAWVAKSSPS